MRSAVETKQSYPGKSPQEYRNDYAFAVVNEDGSATAWGDKSFGGDTGEIQLKLNSGVKEIFSSRGAFAALKNDGSVVTWGSENYGGDSSKVQGDLASGVIQIYSTSENSGSKVGSGAFAALKEDGSVVTWGGGGDMYGADSSGAKDRLSCGVVSVTTTDSAFAALKKDGSVVAWGDGCNGSESCSSLTTRDIEDEISSDVKKLVANDWVFAALKNDGSLVTWGNFDYGGHLSWWRSYGGVQGPLDEALASGVKDIYANSGSFAALKENGKLITWGDISDVDWTNMDKLESGVERVYSTNQSFLAIKDDGSPVFIGDDDASSYGIITEIESDLKGEVEHVFSNSNSFAALKNDGSVISWGSSFTSDTTAVEEQLLSGVINIASTYGAFAALKDDGSVVTWGSNDFGGDSSNVSEYLSSDVKSIHANQRAFAAIKNTGEIITWGADLFTGGKTGIVELGGKKAKTISNPFTTSYTSNEIASLRNQLKEINCGEQISDEIQAGNGNNSEQTSEEIQASNGNNSDYEIRKPKKYKNKFVDTITNFNLSTDSLEIDTDSFGIDSSVTFAAGRNKKKVKKILAKQDFDFLYDEKKGGLYFNENGADKGFGEGGIVAILKGAPELTAENLEFI